jgi:glucokinase
MKYYLGIDWGGTYLKAGLIDENGVIVGKEVFASSSLCSRQAFIQNIKDIRRKVNRYKVSAVGIGAPGIVNVKKGFIYKLPNIKGWENFPLAKTLSRELKAPVFLSNDAKLFALAEARLGSGKNKERVLCFTLGTGLGSAFIYKGKILEGETSAFEMAHVPISIDGRRCGCGATGCIETYVGANYLLSEYARIKKCLRPAEVSEIYAMAQQGDAAALKVWRDFSSILGKFLGGMINIFNPEVIVLGGGVAGAFSLFKPMLVKEIGKQALSVHLEGLKIVKAALKDPGLVGAGLLAADKMNQACDKFNCPSTLNVR